MATLSFDASDDYVEGVGNGPLNGALTLAFLVKRGSTGGHAMFSTVSTGPSAGFSFEYASGNRTAVYNDNAGNITAAPGASHTVTNTTDFYVAVMTRGSGETPRFHLKQIGGGSWVHADGETAQTTNPDSASGGHVRVGVFDLPGVGSTLDDFDGDIALVGWWDGIEFSDVEVEALDDNLQTSDWYNHSVGVPSSLSELTSTSPTDLTGLVTWTVTGAVATGDDPPGWDFDGIGVVIDPPVNTDEPEITGILAVGEELTCSIGTWTGTEPITYTYQWMRGVSYLENDMYLDSDTGDVYQYDGADWQFVMQLAV